MCQRKVLVVLLLGAFGCAHGTDADFSSDDASVPGDAAAGGQANQSTGGRAAQTGTGGLPNSGTGGALPALGGSGGTAETGGQGGEPTTASGGASLGGSVGSGGTTASGGASPTEGLIVKYMVEATAAASTVIGSQLWIENTGLDTVALNELSLRYYFTNEVSAALIKEVNWGHMDRVSGGDYADLAGTVAIDVTPMSNATSSADSYVALGFNAAGLTLRPGYRIKLSWRVQNYQSQNFNQSNDFSYNASLTSANDWHRVVLLRAASVIWGEVP
jgi:hypothetical protein